jgi:hypothetical protein
MKLSILFLLFTLSVFSQKHEKFTGKLVYEITMVDTSLQKIYPTKEMVIFTNDTIVRIENETKQFGKQILIKHTILNKSYLLLNDGLNKFAIQTDLSKTNKTDTSSFQPIYKKKCGNKKILDYKAKKLKITSSEESQPIEILYFKKLSPKYIEAYNDSPGLPIKYTLETSEGLVLYQLKSIKNYFPNHDLFGIPSDFRKISFDEFINTMYNNKNNEIQPK